jgi:LacI family transcriptional regulator
MRLVRHLFGTGDYFAMSCSKKTGRPPRKPASAPPRRRIPRILLLVETSRTYGRGVTEGIARYALENGPWSIQFEERGLDSSPPEWLKEWRGDGIISRTVNLRLAKLLWETKLPLIELFGGRKIGTPQVRTDIKIGGQMIIDHFLNCGLRRFAHFTYEDTWWIKVQREAFCKAIEEKGYRCHVYQAPTTGRTVPTWHERYRSRVIKWLRSLPRPIGIYAALDLHAARLLDICQEINIAVPEEVAIVGVGNDPVVCETVHPTLSSLDLDPRRVGYEAAKLLDQKMSGKQLKDTLYVPPSHVDVRQSTDITVIDDADMVQAMRFIREFACTGIDVQRVAEEVGLSRRVLERRFHQYLGSAPKEEIMRVRIEHAKTLLARTDKTIESIVHRSGFHSLPYFTMAFHREVGMTPNAYRRMRRISISVQPSEDRPLRQ